MDMSRAVSMGGTRVAGWGAGLVLAGGLGTTAPTPAQEALEPGEGVILPETVVSANYVPLKAREVGSSVSVITDRELERRQIRITSDVLRDVPGVSVNRAGPPGTLTQVRIRGAEANQTLVLIDGMQVNNPATGGGFDFATLLAADIERIEVLRGPQSAIWGADALGGVINVTTRRGRPGMHMGGFLEGGTQRTSDGNAYLSGGGERFSFALNGSYYDTGGINISHFGSEDDDYNNTTVNFSGRVNPVDPLELSVNLRQTHSNDQFDPQDFGFGSPTQGLVVDGNERIKIDQTLMTGQGRYTMLDGMLEHIVLAGSSETDTDNLSKGVLTNASAGKSTKYSYQANLFVETPQAGQAEHTLTFYTERRHEEFENVLEPPFSAESQRRSQTNYAYSGEYRLGLWQRLFVSGSVRYDDNQRFKNRTTYRLTGAYLRPESETRLHGSVGTGVKNPSFTELFGFFPSSFVGNPDLKPEKSLGWDAGVEQSLWGGRGTVDLTYFQNDLTDEIETVFDPNTFLLSARNQKGKSKRRGIELSARAGLAHGLSLTGAYTYTDAQDPEGNREVRRPKHTGSLALNWRPLGGRADINLSGQYNGRMKDVVFVPSIPNGRVNLGSYVLVNLAASYTVTDHVQILARIDNLLDDHHEDVFSFRSTGIGAFVGLKVGLERPPRGRSDL